MIKVLAQKISMTQSFDKEGDLKPSTLVWIMPGKIVRQKDEQKDGYRAAVIGCIPKNKISKSVSGLLKKNNIEEKFSRYFELPESNLRIGDSLNADNFSEGDSVVAIGVSKGQGFAGTVKRHNFNTGPKTHGSNNYRQPGSIGSAYPQRVVKGKKMPGRMGSDQITVKGLKVTSIDKGSNTMLISGAIPGPRKSFLFIIKQDN